MKTLTHPLKSDTVLICSNCGTTYEHATKTTCTAKYSKNVPSAECSGPLREVECLVCLESGKVLMADGEVIPCHRGCKPKTVRP